MQTFLPYPDFRKSAQALDTRRLGKQRVEVIQILNALTNPHARGWVNHPAVLMWKGHELALCEYGEVICEEWIYERLCVDNCLSQILRLEATLLPEPKTSFYPAWLGNKDFHLSHQSNLVRKDPAFYGPQFPDVQGNLRYLWPEVSHV